MVIRLTNLLSLALSKFTPSFGFPGCRAEAIVFHRNLGQYQLEQVNGMTIISKKTTNQKWKGVPLSKFIGCVYEGVASMSTAVMVVTE